MGGLRWGTRRPTYARSPHVQRHSMSPVRVRPLGGGVGCLMMIAVSVLLSVVLTVLVNVLR